MIKLCYVFYLFFIVFNYYLYYKMKNTNFFTDEFNRMWEYYLITCMVLFEKKQMQLTQFIITKVEYNEMYIFSEKD